MLEAVLPLLLIAGIEIDSQHLDVRLAPSEHVAVVRSDLRLRGSGPLVLELTDRAEVGRVLVDDREAAFRRSGAADGSVGRLEVDVPAGAGSVRIEYRACLKQDAAAGERPGEIHNFSVDAHIGEDGVFLSDGSAWHPQPLGHDGREALHRISVSIAPLEGWAMVCSGDPVADPAVKGGLETPRWRWETPRPVEGMAIAGNRHVLHGAVHETPHGPVEIVMHVPPEHAELAPLFVSAAAEYLDLYTPLLGVFPYRRFSIVENFFSSGFAYPGFTLLGPQVVGMAPRSLAPGYLDHELIHNWWGNGVYVDPGDGNWCEALTSYCANYYRRIADGGEEAGRDYRRGVLMKLSTDPDGLDDGPLGLFGSADPSSPGPERFVGYDKGAFVFAMLEEVLDPAGPARGGAALWTGLRRFAEENLGRRAGWNDLQDAFESAVPDRASGWLDGFFRYWVREHHAPRTTNARLAGAQPADAIAAFAREFPSATRQRVHVTHGSENAWCEIDPEFKLYRVLPPGQIVPTIAGTFGPGAFAVRAEESRDEVVAYLGRLEPDPGGENLLLIGATAQSEGDLLAQTADPIELRQGSFTVGGDRYDGAGQAVLHTMPHPRRPGRFITVFHSNGDAGWSRLRLIGFYTRDTTIVWDGGRVIERRVFEPERRLYE